MIRYDPHNGQGRDRSPPALCLDIRIRAYPPVKSRCHLRASAQPWSSEAANFLRQPQLCVEKTDIIMTSETTVSGTDNTCIASGRPGGFLEKSHSAAEAATALIAIVILVPGTVKSIFRPSGRFRPLRQTPPRDANKRARTHFCVTKRPSQASDNSETAGTPWRVRRRAPY